MARKQANLLVRFNFDSLTDTITNLTGTLILVVVLVMGITSQVRLEGLGPTAREHTAASLQERLVLVQRQTQEIDRQIRDLQQQCSAVESRFGAMPRGPASPPDTPRPPAGAPPASPFSPPAQPPQPSLKSTAPGGKLLATPVKAGPVKELPVLVALHLVAAAPASPPADPTTDAALAALARRRAIVEQVETAVAAAGETIRGQTARLDVLRQSIDTLRSKLAKTPPRPTPPPPGKTDGEGKRRPEKLIYRPPIEKFTRKVPIRFVCQENRISVLPLDTTVEERLRAFVSAERISEGQSKLFEFDFPKCDLLIRGVADKTVAQFEVVRKPSRPGETGDEIRVRTPRSLFLDALEATPGCSPATHCALFYVWPDSFDVYRKARSLVWETRVGGAQYSTGWKPMSTTEKMQFVRQPGPGSSVPVQDY